MNTRKPLFHIAAFFFAALAWPQSDGAKPQAVQARLVEAGSVIARSIGGELPRLIRYTDQFGLFVFQPGIPRLSRHETNGNSTVIRLAEIPELGRGQFYFMPDLAITADGNVYVPATWRGSGAKLSAGVFVLDVQGGYLRTVGFQPPVDVRRIAIAGNGDILALGIDPAYLQNRTSECMLVHRYSPDGRRLDAFSACPANLNLRLARGVRAGPDLPRLRQEVDRGQIWIDSGRVFHTLPGYNRMRVFDSGGKLHQIDWTAPDTAALFEEQRIPAGVTVPDRVTAVVSLPQNRFLVRWAHGERNSTLIDYLTVMGADGRPISRPFAGPWRRASPFLARPNGELLFIRHPDRQNVEIIGTRLLLD